MNEAERITAAVDVDEVVGLTQDLVRIPSENPPGNESQVVDYLVEYFDGLGLASQVVEPAEGRRSLLVSSAPAKPSGKPVLLVNGHIDTVPAQASSWTFDPFGGKVEGGRLYGRGATDMKGGIAAALTAYSLTRQLDIELPCDIAFHLVADEELGGALGTGYLHQRGLIQADACLVPEPTNLKLCLAERGLLFAKIITKGIPAHGSEPSKGRSAIMAAAAIAEALHDSKFSDRSHPLLGSTTCNVGMIRGGSGPNVVPEYCELMIDRRAIPGDTEAGIIESVVRRIATIGLPPEDYEIEVGTYCEPSEIAHDHPFVSTVAKSFQAITGLEPGVTGLPFTTDARFLRNQLGVPAVVFGPGSLAQAHAIDEFVEVDDLVTAVGVYAHMFTTFAGF